MPRQHRHNPNISVGARYRRREGGNAVWEVYGVLVGGGGLPHVMLFNVSDSTLRKTLSEFTLEQSGLYCRVPES
jgi:hypothetical protein